MDESHDQDAHADLKDVVLLQKLIERTPAIDPLLIVVGIRGEELFSFFASLFFLDLGLIHGFSISVVCFFVGVLDAAFNQHDAVYLRIVCFAFDKLYHKFTILYSSLDLDTIDVQLTAFNLEVDKFITRQQLGACVSERIHVFDNRGVTDHNIKHFHARLPEVAF